MDLITIPGAEALTTLPKLNINNLTSTIIDIPKVPSFNFEKQSLNDLGKIKQNSLKKNANYLDGIKAQQDNLKKQLTTDVAAKQKLLVPATPKLKVNLPSVPGGDGLQIPSVFVCSPNFDGIINAVDSAINTISEFIPPMPPMPTFDLPKLPKLPSFPNIDDYWKMVPEKCKKQFKATNPNATIPELILLIASCKDLLPDAPSLPSNAIIEAIKDFCKPPVEAPAGNVLLPKVKTETVTHSELDAEGNFVQTSTTVTKMESPMDKANINDKAQIKILGEAKRQEAVKAFILELPIIKGYASSLEGYLNAELAFHKKYSDISNHPMTASGWADVLNEYQVIVENIQQCCMDINMFFYKQGKAILEQNPSNETAVALVNIYKMAETHETIAGFTKHEFFHYFTFTSPFTKSPRQAAIYGPEHLDMFSNLLYITHAMIFKYAFTGDFGENSDSWSPNSLNDFTDKLKSYKEIFDNCKCEVWKNAGTEDAFDNMSVESYKDKVKLYATDMAIKKDTSFDYPPTILEGKSSSFNFTSSKILFPKYWIEAQIKILESTLRESLPIQG